MIDFGVYLMFLVLGPTPGAHGIDSVVGPMGR